MRPFFYLSLLLVAAPLLAGPSLALPPEGASASPLVVIANSSVKAAAISRSDLSNIFLKRRLTWEDGGRVAPVDQPVSSLVRRSFSERVHKKNVSAVKAFWEQQIFSGADVPPPVKNSDNAVLAFVRATPGAVGYVSAAADVSGVVVLAIEGL